MINTELVQRISEQYPRFYRRDAERILNAILGQIMDALARRDRVEIRGFGAFSVRARQARVGRNPRSGSTVSIPEKVFPWFRPSKEMHKRLNPGSGNSA